MADIPNMIKAIGTHPGARIANIVVVAILAILIALLNLWLFVASCVSIGQVNSLSATLAARNALVPVFQYFIYTVCIISSVVAFIVCVVQGVLAVPPIAERIPKALSLIVSVICSGLTISIFTTFCLSFLTEIAIVEGFEIFPKGGTMSALVATHASLIIVYIFFLPVMAALNLTTLVATAVRAVVLYDDQNVVTNGKVLRPAQSPRQGGDTEFVSPGNQDYSLESSV
mmetsp:Transcript_4062/g.15293  ORF Transcript_4062/g.15293 Transcript_4062/m.15293 type:complete len:228 (-) Transcript_4062:111-794(-)|eukprot:CAMPEP_0117443430 /NCGR_PEP_ID=MMETSP0759-20121206/4690_1 /TAXON_ID=63605 /ORGANISM="Percolomonas cosmopolitus, Strain WS" /LENGTH=227 /DNA_ID=CAMNT_0005235403 /DNA_START=483 /DNA_END=1166 /DNA_ORIENTATION=+